MNLEIYYLNLLPTRATEGLEAHKFNEVKNSLKINCDESENSSLEFDAHESYRGPITLMNSENSLKIKCDESKKSSHDLDAHEGYSGPRGQEL